MREHYTIDLKTNVLDIRTYPVEMIRADLKLLGLKRPMDLDLTDTFNTKIFRTESDAEKWRSKFLKRKSELLRKAKAVKGMPKMLCKQRYIILASLGEKMYTRRHYKKSWTVGTKFQLYDQKIFLTVRLTKLTDTQDGSFTYEYERC